MKEIEHMGIPAEVLAMVAHDLRSPLSAILLGVGLLEGGRDEKTLSAIKRAAQRMQILIEDLLDAQRIVDGRLTLDLERLRINSVLEEIRELMEPAARAKSLSLEVVPTDGAVVADRSRLLQVFGNLVGNAVKFTPAGGRVVLRAQVRDDEVIFAVEDNGPGIAEDGLPHVFDRYWQGGATRRTGGSGLGLYIAQKIVAAHGGRLWVESDLGLGSVFRFSVPTHAAGEVLTMAFDARRSLDTDRITDIMTVTPYCVRADVRASSVTEFLLEHRMSGAPVIDVDGRPLGVVSKTDLLQHFYDRSQERIDDRVAVTAADLMTPVTFALPADATVARAAALMACEGVHRVPIVDDDGEVVGIITALDVARWVARLDGFVV